MLAYYYPNPPQTDNQLVMMSLRLTRAMPLLFLFMSSLFLTNPQMFTNQLKPKETEDDDQAVFDPLTFVYTSRKDLYGQITPLFIGFGIIFVLVIFREL